MSWDEWKQNMLLSISGQITVKNIEYDLSHDRIPPDLADNFINDICARWDKCPPNKSPEEIFTEVVEAAPDTYFCKGTVIPAEGQSCVRVMTGDDFVNFHVSGRAHIRGHVSDKDMNRLMFYSLKDIILEGSELKGNYRRHVWVTHLDELVQELKRISADDQASHVRNLLGLLHYKGNEYLVGIVFHRSGSSADGKLSAPTFLEGSPAIIYRSRKTPDGWGRAVNLNDFSDGLKEAIHPAVKLNEYFRVMFIGRINAPLPPNAMNWMDFLHKM